MGRDRQGRDFIARHGETVFNASRRLQGDILHTPLTRAGFAQADELGRALRAELGPKPALTLWASPTGRALQTLAVIVEHLDLDWHAARTDARLREIGVGSWDGRLYADVVDEFGPILVGGHIRSVPDGETYGQVADRLASWLADTDDDAGDRLVVMHGASSCVLRGIMTGREVDVDLGVPIADGLPQGSVALIEGRRESVPHRGTGYVPA